MPSVIDRGRLAQELSRALAGEVRFDEGSRALYANDASIYRQVPAGVVIPRDADDVAAMAVCRRFGAPVLGRGRGTGPAGQTVGSGVVFDFSKYMNSVLEIDPVRRPALRDRCAGRLSGRQVVVFTGDGSLTMQWVTS